jgi:hypothetical protein
MEPKLFILFRFQLSCFLILISRSLSNRYLAFVWRNGVAYNLFRVLKT